MGGKQFKFWTDIFFGLELHDAYPEYKWFPDTLINATHSAENLAHQLHDHTQSNKLPSRGNLEGFIRQELLERGLGVSDASDEEVNRLIDESDPWPASYIFADIISRRAEIGWTTHGHSGELYQFFSLSFPSSSSSPSSIIFLVSHSQAHQTKPTHFSQPSTSISTPPIPNKPSH